MKKCVLVLPFLFLLLMISCGEDGSGKTDYSAADELDQIAESGLKDSLFAGAVLLVGDLDGVLHQRAFGYAEQIDFGGFEIESPVEMTNNHLFDLASLTKVLGTTLGVMVLHDRNQININDPLHKYLPEFDTPDKQSITLAHLLSHTSGLVQWFPSFYEANSPEERLQFTVDEPLLGTPGETRRYSDFGFMVLGDVIESVSGQSMDQFLAENIYRPMGLNSTVFNPDTAKFSLVATSHGNPFEKRMVYDDDFGYTVDVDPESWNGWREHTLKGEVNDGNAFYTQGGVAGHAGLFSTAEEVYALLKLFINNGRFEGEELFSPETIDLFTEKDEFGHGLGWMMSEASLNTVDLTEGSFGHTGFTGTNIIVSPEKGRILVFLTNRQHFGVDEDGQYPNLREIREKLSVVVFEE
ncbi:MAG: serine hydrolase domain-containing protein [Balneolaceae bacterium]